MDEWKLKINKIFFKYRNKTMIMSWDDDDFVNLYKDLVELFYGYWYAAADILFNREKVEPYLKEFNISFIEEPHQAFKPSLEPNPKPAKIKEPASQASGEGLPMRSTNEIKRMQKLAGIFEEKETKTKEADLNVGLVFDTEELRDKALNTLKKQKLPLVYYSKDAVNIEFPLYKNSKLSKEKLTQVIDKISHQFTKGKLHNSLTEFTNEG